MNPQKTVIIVFIASVLIAFFSGMSAIESKPNPTVKNPTYSCNTNDFLEEYNFSAGPQNYTVYNNNVYQIVRNSYGGVLPIIESSCSLELNETYLEEVLTYASLSDRLDEMNLKLYRDLAACYSLSAGARPLCSITTGVKDAISSPSVTAAVNNEAATLSIVNRLTPNGWKKETVDATKNLIKLTKEIKGPGSFALAFEVVDASSCFLKGSIAVQVYDYSLNVGDDLWYRIKYRNAYEGHGKDLYDLNTGLLSLMSKPDLQSTLNNFMATSVGGKNCDTKGIATQLSSINEKIDLSKKYGNADASGYLRWILPIKNHADKVRLEARNKTNSEAIFSLWGFTTSIVFPIAKVTDYLEAKQHYDSAENFYQRGLFISAEKEYNNLVISVNKWDTRSTVETIISWVLLLLATTGIICIIYCKWIANTNNYWGNYPG